MWGCLTGAVAGCTKAKPEACERLPVKTASRGLLGRDVAARETDEAEKARAKEDKREGFRSGRGESAEVIETLVRQVDLLDVEGESVQSRGEAGEAEGERRDAVWSNV